jgi:hypothetical protein
VEFFFDPVKFASVQLAVSPSFALPSAASPLIDVVTPSRRVTLHSQGAKMDSLSPLHLVASTLESKSKH